jgi:hypothetical protein
MFHDFFRENAGEARRVVRVTRYREPIRSEYFMFRFVEPVKTALGVVDPTYKKSFDGSLFPSLPSLPL